MIRMNREKARYRANRTKTIIRKDFRFAFLTIRRIELSRLRRIKRGKKTLPIQMRLFGKERKGDVL